MKRIEIIKKYKEILINIIKYIDVYKIGRRNKFNISFYLNYIFRILFYGEHWNTFYCIDCDRSTIRKKFYKWRNMGIFIEAYKQLFKLYNSNKTIKYLYIDSAIIQNMNCSDNKIHFHYKMKTKKSIKLSIICDNNYTVNSYVITNPKIHDSKLTKQLTDNLKCKLKRKSKLIGDKGYINKNIKLIKNRQKIKLVTPLRINQKNKKLLRNRFKVESLFGILKRTCRRLQLINDRLLINYETFLIMAITCQLIRTIYKNK